MEENIQTPEMNQVTPAKKQSGLATAGVVFGIIGVVLAFIPVVNFAAYPLGGLAFIFGLVACIQKASPGKAITSIVLGVLAVIIAIVMTFVAAKALVNAIDDATDELSSTFADMTGENTDELLGTKVDVKLGDFTVTEGEYIDETALPVTVTNLDTESHSFSIQIEAVDADGTRIDNDYVYSDTLGAGQTQDFEIFTLVTDDKTEALKGATFKIVEISMY